MTAPATPRDTTPFGVVDWAQWTVILLKPDCLRRGLADAVLQRVGRVVTVSAVRSLIPTEAQVFAHYDDMLPPEVCRTLGLDVPAELRRIFVDNQVIVALGHGHQAADRLRAVLGGTDPSLADPNSIRGHFGADNLATARAEGRLIDNLIHTSDHTGVVERDFTIWYGAANRHLLIPTTERSPQ
ncbi:nucleoside-diphosphate kinase [Actinoallomurus iriomotensis]|uniref:nucleoside-diphosphate kinase n=1 Tax=Actinoallomurus iriomotensis TaxID=478107 RepID=UPI0025536512|nr:nucleoside-diphosphate kinase [Actinoallomurus iriomotensis]